MIGFGTVGQGVVKMLDEQAEAYARRLARPIVLRSVLVRNASAPREVALPEGVLTDDPDAFFGAEGVSIVVEAAGGLDPIGGYVIRALEAGKHVVTANKALLAARGAELFALARSKGVSIAFEASCGGGMPILEQIKFGLASNRINAVYGILNGTCNYILTQMLENGQSYDDALADAQELGYAEADPELDVNGADAAQKLAIIASLAFGVCVNEKDVSHVGIDGLDGRDIGYGASLGYGVKLLAIGERVGDGLALGVEPCFISTSSPLTQVRLSYNALSVFGHAVGHSMSYGHGAGQMPTASAMVSDILNVASGWYPHAFEVMRLWPDQQDRAVIVGAESLESRFYLRVNVTDRPGVMAKIVKALGDQEISISAVVQNEGSGDGAPGVPVVITTHRARRGSVQQAIAQIGTMDVVHGEPICIRIADLPEG
jgi:homoserine dehydrogenase